MIIKPNNVEIDVAVAGDYNPAEKETLDHPGCGASFYTTSVTHNGVEIIDYLSDNVLEEIESKYLKGEN